MLLMRICFILCCSFSVGHASDVHNRGVLFLDDMFKDLASMDNTKNNSIHAMINYHDAISKPDQQEWGQRIRNFTDAYRRSAKMAVHQHTQSWNPLVATETEIGTLHNRTRARQNILARYPNLQSYRQSMMQSQRHDDVATKTATAPTKEQPLIWDHEDDADSYLNYLAAKCSNKLNATDDPDFVTNCFGAWKRLALEPRCTLRLDSRYKCGGQRLSVPDIPTDPVANTPQRDLKAQTDPRDLILEHFAEDTLNVVIVGAGPSGLFLANSLAYLETKQKNITTSVRVLVFESRIDSPGRKKPYTRDWIAEIHHDDFVHIDSRIMSVIDEIEFEDDDVRDGDDDNEAGFSIYLLETLLLLSSRAKGAKFLYEDHTHYEDVLATIPNLVVFDASGHRLDKLDRDGALTNNEYDSNYQLEYAKWSPHGGFGHADVGQRNWTYLKEPDYKALNEYGYEVNIVEQTSKQGKILYPVTSETSEPYVVRMLKLNQFAYDLDASGPTAKWKSHNLTVMKSENVPICQDLCEQHPEFNCGMLCNMSNPWDNSEGFRDDILHRFENESESPGYATMVAVITLTPEQFDGLDYMMAGAKSELPLSNIPLDDMMYSPLFERNNFVHTMRFFATCTVNNKYPLLSIYTHTPYIYADALVPLTAETGARIGSAPLLRVGDSLLSGNTNLATGLTMHVAIIAKYMDMLAKLL